METKIVSYEVKDTNESGLKLCPAILSDEYREEWGERSSDFLCLFKDGKLVSDTLYRTGAFGGKMKGDYFDMIKYVESRYPHNNKKYLNGLHCIIDKNGVEKFVAKGILDHPYIIEGSCVFSMDGRHYNIETGELYCSARTKMVSDEYIFLDNNHIWGDDKSKQGVMRIDKKTGEYIIYKG